MKFQKVIPAVEWPKEKTQERIEVIKMEIAELHRQMNKKDSEINDLTDKKKQLVNRVANKWKYLRQLEAQLKEKQVL